MLSLALALTRGQPGGKQLGLGAYYRGATDLTALGAPGTVGLFKWRCQDLFLEFLVAGPYLNPF